MRIVFSLIPLLLTASWLASAAAQSPELCQIKIVDAENGWPVPLVELRTTHDVCFYSDNSGVIAFDLPELMDQEIWVTVEGHGYSVPKDRFGYRGVRLVPRAGQTVTIKVQRQLPAKRLGRITGAGLFAESQKLGNETDWKEQGVLGCDSVQNAVHNGRLFWLWGDTVLAGYPLGRFHMIGASTSLQPLQSLKPPLRLRYDYFRDETFRDAGDSVRNLAKMPGDGPTWLNGYVSLTDESGYQRLVATYSKIKPPLEVYEIGQCVWDERTSRFKRSEVVWAATKSKPKPPPVPHGHAVLWEDQNHVSWVLFGDPFPSIKCPATYEGWSDPATWEQLEVQKDVPVLGSTQSVQPHRGAIAWNAYRNKWVTIFTQLNGQTSNLGELWYAEATSPFGPWKDAVHVVTHNQYSFYNPKLHPEFTADGSAILLFEATYTKTFSKTKQATPRHNYNQVLYRLDMDELVNKVSQ